MGDQVGLFGAPTATGQEEPPAALSASLSASLAGVVLHDHGRHVRVQGRAPDGRWAVRACSAAGADDRRAAVTYLPAEYPPLARILDLLRKRVQGG